MRTLSFGVLFMFPCPHLMVTSRNWSHGFSQMLMSHVWLASAEVLGWQLNLDTVLRSVLWRYKTVTKYCGEKCNFVRPNSDEHYSKYLSTNLHFHLVIFILNFHLLNEPVRWTWKTITKYSGENSNFRPAKFFFKQNFILNFYKFSSNLLFYAFGWHDFDGDFSDNSSHHLSDCLGDVTDNQQWFT